MSATSNFVSDRKFDVRDMKFRVGHEIWPWYLFIRVLCVIWIVCSRQEHQPTQHHHHGGEGTARESKFEIQPPHEVPSIFPPLYSICVFLVRVAGFTTYKLIDLILFVVRDHHVEQGLSVPRHGEGESGSSRRGDTPGGRRASLPRPQDERQSQTKLQNELRHGGASRQDPSPHAIGRRSSGEVAGRDVRRKDLLRTRRQRRSTVHSANS